MWAGAEGLFERFMGPSEQEQPQPQLQLQLQPQRNFDANTCIQLLNVLPAAEQALRQSALGRLRSFMAQDEERDQAAADDFDAFQAPPTLPRLRRPPPRRLSSSSSFSSSNSGSEST